MYRQGQAGLSTSFQIRGGLDQGSFLSGLVNFADGRGTLGHGLSFHSLLCLKDSRMPLVRP